MYFIFTYSRGCNYKPELRCRFFNAQKDEKKNLLLYLGAYFTNCTYNYAILVLVLQEVPAFCDFWYQKGITKFGDHKF